MEHVHLTLVQHDQERVTAVLTLWGKVSATVVGGEIVHWYLVPDDPEAFCAATHFHPYEAKWGGFNIVRHELFRVAAILNRQA